MGERVGRSGSKGEEKRVAGSGMPHSLSLLLALEVSYPRHLSLRRDTIGPVMSSLNQHYKSLPSQVPASTSQIVSSSGLQYMADYTVRALTDLLYVKVRPR